MSGEGEHFTTETYRPPTDANSGKSSRKSPDELSLNSWLKRELPLRDYLLGNVVCTTSRWLIFGDTGIGKTLLACDMAGAMGSGSEFLGWEARRKARVMYLDGEMPAETFKERMAMVGDLYGSGIPLFGYNRDVLDQGEMPPLNTPEGEAWLWREIELVKPDAIFFDSIMCLLAGSMSDEESWAPVKLLMRKLTARQIAQIWLNHTGHDASKSYGTKTREWELDTVLGLLKPPERSNGMLMDFRKARLRTPSTAGQFKSRVVIRGDAGWQVSGDEPMARKALSEREAIRNEILRTYDRLADAAPTSLGLDGRTVRKVRVDRLRDEMKSRGFLETGPGGGLTDKARTYFNRAKLDLLAAPKPRLFEQDGYIWK